MSDICSKVSEVMKNIKKTLECTKCHKLPDDSVVAKCGHILCQGCANEIVNRERGVCGLCKNIIFRSGLNPTESCRKIVADFKALCEALCEASEKDASASTPGPRQYPSKWRNLSLPGASSTGSSTIKSLGQRGGGAKRTAKKASLDFAETIKFNATNSKKTDPPARLKQAESNTDKNSAAFTTDELSSEIGAIGSTEKVKGWLLSESFEEKTFDPSEFPEIPARPASPTSSATSDLESFSQIVSKSKRNPGSRAASAQREIKGKSKTREITVGDEILDRVWRDRSDKEKPKTGSKATESSWSELEQLKKDARPNVRKRKRINVSIERPSSGKPVVESFDIEDSEDGDNKNLRHNESDEITDSAKKRMKLNIKMFVSCRKLDENERLPVEIEKLNKRQVKMIIGVNDSDVSKNSTGSLEKSFEKLSLRKSINSGKNKSNNEEGNSRPESRQSFQPNETRPESRLSNRSLGKRNSDKFRLSTKILATSTPKTSPATDSVDQNTAREEVEEKIEVKKSSPLRTSSDFIRNRLLLRRGSSGSSKTTESRVLSITKLGKLYKPKYRIKFYHLGPILPRLERTELSSAVLSLRESIDTRDTQTQTSPEELEGPNEKLEACKIIAQPSTAVTSSKISSDELDTANKVNIMSPRDDSQLKYLATESPTVPRIGILESQQSTRRITDVSKTTGELSFVSSGTHDFFKNVKKYAEKLIATDSEDQDTPIEDFGRKNIDNEEKIKSLNTANKKNEVETAPNRVKSVQKSSSVHSGRNASPMTHKLSGSESKRGSTEKPQSQGKSEAETEIISKAKSRDGSYQAEDSEPILSNAKHKVVRKLDYSQESRSTRTSEPGKSESRSFEDRETRVLSHNSDKENELGKVSNIAARGDSKKSKENLSKDSPINTEPFGNSNLNITQEQLLMQEIEDNLLGRNTNGVTHKENQDNKVPDQSSIGNKERTPSRREKLRPKGYSVAQIESDDSANVSDEDIIESTPEKNLLSKKDLSTHVENSQRSNTSLKSFMSVDMTPIPNRVPKILQLGSDVSPLVERNSRLSSNQDNLRARISSHSTPKTVVPSTENRGISQSVPRSVRLCFVCSCLTLAQVQNVKAFARTWNAEYTATYKPEVTHVIVKTNESDTAGRTMKYLLGVAHKKWIVSYRWVVDCMSEGILLPEDNYEAVDSDTEERGPRRSRLRETGLFDEFAFACMEPFSDITISQLRDLITSWGGIVVESLEELAALDGRHKVILYNGDVHTPEVLANWHSRGRALPVKVEWALFCISQYQLMSFRDYYDYPDPDLVLEMGYPSELINEEEDDSANEASTLQGN